MNEAELLPLIDWLSLLETKKNILVVKFVFDPEKEMYQAILQEEK